MILSQCCDCREPSVRLLQPAGNTPTILEMDKMKENANFFLACQKMRDGLHEEAIASFKDQKSPHASFYTGKIYQKLAMEEASETGLECGGRMRELLVESRESFYLTGRKISDQGQFVVKKIFLQHTLYSPPLKTSQNSFLLSKCKQPTKITWQQIQKYHPCSQFIHSYLLT